MEMSNSPLQGTEAPASIDAMQTGSFGIRFGGRVIDLVVGGLMGFVGGILGVMIAGILAAVGKAPSDWLQRIQAPGNFLLSMGWGLLASFMYHSIAEGVGGTSIGKIILGFRVVREDLKPPSIGQAAIRSAAYLIDAFFFGVPAYQSMQNGPYNQRLGDKWAKTIVIRTGAIPQSARRSSGLIFLGVACGMGAQATVMAISMVAKVF